MRLKFSDTSVNLNSKSKSKDVPCECKGKDKGEIVATYDSSDPLLEVAFDKLQHASRDKIRDAFGQEATR